MEFKRARNKEQFEQRKTDIINSAISIYEEFGIDEVTFSKISEKTKFTRPTIYSYFKTKEEILLRLTVIYLERFVLCLEENLQGDGGKDREYVAQALTSSFREVGEFTHLYTVLFSMIEKNVSVEALAEFKRDVVEYQNVLVSVFKTIYPKSSDEEIRNFILFCLCFASGLCPMTEENEIQRQAIELSGTGYVTPDFEAVFKHTLLIYLEKLRS